MWTGSWSIGLLVCICVRGAVGLGICEDEDAVVCVVCAKRLCVPENECVVPLEVLCSRPIEYPGFRIDVGIYGDATPGKDFILAECSLEIPVGSIFFTVDLNIVDDAVCEGTESIGLSFYTVSAPLACSDFGPLPEVVLDPSSFTINILDDEEGCPPEATTPLLEATTSFETTRDPFFETTTPAAIFEETTPLSISEETTQESLTTSEADGDIISCTIFPTRRCVTEGDKVIIVEVLCNRPIDICGFVINIDIEGDATMPDDYIFCDRQLEIPVGTVYFTADLYIIDDAIPENTEALVVTSSSVTPPSHWWGDDDMPEVVVCSTPVTVTVNDDDGNPSSGGLLDPRAVSPGRRNITEPCQDNNPCNTETQICLDFQGMAVCVCDVGYQFSNGACLDIDECLIIPCADKENQECVNTIGNFRCNCRAGYDRSEAGQCEDIDECLGSPCTDEYEECRNTVGSFRCDCQPGYRRSIDGHCQGMAACLSLPDACEEIEHSHCVDSASSDDSDDYVCVCDDGYDKTANGSCVTRSSGCIPGACDQINYSYCVEDSPTGSNEGSYRCVCVSGYTKIENGSCVDRRTTGCLPGSCDHIDHSYCVTTAIPGSSILGIRCLCDDGYMETDTGACVEHITGCLPGSCDLIEHSHCVTTTIPGSSIPGSRCLCDAGYMGKDDGSCVEHITGCPPGSCDLIEHSHCETTTIPGSSIPGSRCLCDAGYIETDNGSCVERPHDSVTSSEPMSANLECVPYTIILAAAIPLSVGLLVLNLLCWVCLRRTSKGAASVDDEPHRTAHTWVPSSSMSNVVRNPLARAQAASTEEERRMRGFEKVLRRMNKAGESENSPVDTAQYTGDENSSTFSLPYQADGAVNI